MKELVPTKTTANLHAQVCAILLCVFLASQTAFALKTASSTGAWSSTATWGGAAVPTATDSVVINTGVTVSMSSAFTTTGTLTMNGTAVLNLNGYNASFLDFASSVNTATVTDNSAAAGTDTFNVTKMTHTIASLIKDGATRHICMRVGNNNVVTSMFTLTNANTFSGGLILTDIGGSGTRLSISSAISTVGSAGAITSSPFGTGTIFIGESAADNAGFYVYGTTNNTLANNIVFNTALGTDRAGIRIDVTGFTMSGTITANNVDATFSTNGTGGLNLNNSNGTSLTLTLNNAGTANNYQGATTLNGTKDFIVLGAVNQIPSGSGFGNMTNNGTLKLNGLSTTLNGLNGAGTIDGISGTPLLTVGSNNATSSFSGVIKNSAGSLAVTKIGTGTQTLSGANTYTGATTVSTGILQLGSLAPPPAYWSLQAPR